MKKFLYSILAIVAVGVLIGAENLGVQSTSTIYDNKLLVTSNAAHLYQLFGYNSGTNSFVQVFDTATAPANGAVPTLSFRVFADANFSLNRDFIPWTFSRGVYICNSSTATNLTLMTASNCLFYTQHYAVPQ